MADRPYASKHMVGRDRTLRQTPTPPEKLLWFVLRNDQIGGMKFHHQYPIGPYVADFFCHRAGLVVELDGMSHDDKIPQDGERTKHLESQGLRVLRVTNEDVMHGLDAVV